MSDLVGKHEDRFSHNEAHFQDAGIRQEPLLLYSVLILRYHLSLSPTECFPGRHLSQLQGKYEGTCTHHAWIHLCFCNTMCFLFEREISKTKMVSTHFTQNMIASVPGLCILFTLSNVLCQ